ncbi:MAG: hypothetical protein HY700_15980 [Gemmatimonadetes bacterium]|nr:hypothetical protein [Gemmatimonadota bacterium]
MFPVVLAALVAIAIAAAVYLGWERQGNAGLGMAALRAGALVTLIVLFFNPARTQRVRGGPPTVLLDASLSMGAQGAHWQTALDTALELAASGGTVLRFGSEIAPFDSVAPAAGATRLNEALRIAAGRPGPVIVVTDGAVDDADVIPPALLRGVTVVLVRRDTVADAALMDVVLEPRVQRGDSVNGAVLISTVGPLAAAKAQLEISEAGRRLVSLELPLPRSPGVARRPFQLPGRLLTAGTHVLRFELKTPGDVEPGDDTRQRMVVVSEQPAVVVLVNPSDWEGRFLVSTLAEVAHTTVRGFARVRPDRWVDMRTLVPVSENELRSAVRGAALVAARGDVGPELAGWRGPVWRWPAGTDVAAQSIPGDWYVDGRAPASPVAGRLTSVEWDSVPPLDLLVPMVVAAGDWVGLRAKLSRRGAERPVLVGRDSAGNRMATTAADGLYRWGLRGGAAREAYRAVIAGTVDWLLGADAIRRTTSLTSSEVVARGMPLAFHWTRDPIPDSAVVRLSRGDTSLVSILRFDTDAMTRLAVPPGVWHWSVLNGAERGGTAVVEEYSDEFRMRPVTLNPSTSGEWYSTIELRPREWWWLFVVAVIAFCGEWAWRLRRGLP